VTSRAASNRDSRLVRNGCLRSRPQKALWCIKETRSAVRGETRESHKLSILIVNDNLLLRQGLKQMLAQEYRDIVFGEAGTAWEALARIKAAPWRLVILDVSLPDGDGFSVLWEISVHHPQTAVLMLSMHGDSTYAARASQLGAAGFISKSCGRSDLLKAVRSVLDGRKYFSESIPRGVDNPGSVALRKNLSAREYKVLLALAAGRRTGEIAAELNLSPKTVSTYKRRVLNKLGVDSTAGLVRYVIGHNLS
jgi:two-component system, NarL family, invasion response regulator UvrY